MNHNQYHRLVRIYDSIGKILGSGYDVAFILGSGYKGIAENVIERSSIKIRIPYKEIRGFPDKVIKGQSGEIVTAEYGNRKIIFFCGRFHYYQGYSSFEIGLPVRISKMLGAKILIITNAAGGINKTFKPGDLMIIRDHINLMKNPLIGFSVEGYDIFVDMSEPYSKRLRIVAINVAKEMGFEDKFKEGVYLGTTGPSYETKAEIEFFKRIGADAVGMSTVPEVIVAKQEELEVFGISVITNMAAGISKSLLSHSEVLETMEKTNIILNPFFKRFLYRIMQII